MEAEAAAARHWSTARGRRRVGAGSAQAPARFLPEWRFLRCGVLVRRVAFLGHEIERQARFPGWRRRVGFHRRRFRRRAATGVGLGRRSGLMLRSPQAVLRQLGPPAVAAASSASAAARFGLLRRCRRRAPPLAACARLQRLDLVELALQEAAAAGAPAAGRGRPAAPARRSARRSARPPRAALVRQPASSTRTRQSLASVELRSGRASRRRARSSSPAASETVGTVSTPSTIENEPAARPKGSAPEPNRLAKVSRACSSSGSSSPSAASITAVERVAD